MENVVKEESKKKKLIIGVFVFVIVLLSAALIYFVFIKKDKNDEPVKPQDNQQTINNNAVATNVYKTADGKFTLKIIDNKTAYLNDKLFIIFDIKDDSKYAHYHGDFDGEGSQSGYNFLVDKEKGIIVEGDISNVKNLNDRMLRFYGEGDLSKNINFIKCAAGYYFVDDFAIEGSIVEIYTTDWKLLGYVDIDNIKSDKDGVYVYEDYEPFDKLVGNPMKYDINGNKIN